MSKPRYRWWGYARNVIRAYPKLRVAESLTADDKKELEAVEQAIELAKKDRNGEQMLDLIRRVYLDRSVRRVEDAARYMYVSERTARQRHGDFVRLVGKCLGFSVEQQRGKQGRPEGEKGAQ